MKELLLLISSLEEKINMMEQEQTQISTVKVGWHIQHCLLVINNVITNIKHSDPKTYQWKFNLNKTLILTFGKIPRGKGKAPKGVQPKDEVTQIILLEGVSKAKENIVSIANIQKNQYFLHPLFGHLNLKPTIKFLKIHTKHHLDIINDIINFKA